LMVFRGGRGTLVAGNEGDRVLHNERVMGSEKGPTKEDDDDWE
jgi:hypothetical protein